MPARDLPRQQQRGEDGTRPPVRNQTAGHLGVQAALGNQVPQRRVLPLRHQLQVRHAGQAGQGGLAQQQNQTASGPVRLHLRHRMTTHN